MNIVHLPLSLLFCILVGVAQAAENTSLEAASLLVFPDGFNVTIKPQLNSRSSVVVWNAISKSSVGVELELGQSSCGCLSSELSKQLLFYGESVNASASIAYGEMEGSRSDTVTLIARQVDPPRRTEQYTLTVNYELPAFGKASSTRLEWRADEVGEKQFSVEPLFDGLVIADYKLIGEGFKVVDKKSVFRPDKYIITVERIASEDQRPRTIAAIKVNFNYKGELSRTKTVFLVGNATSH